MKGLCLQGAYIKGNAFFACTVFLARSFRRCIQVDVFVGAIIFSTIIVAFAIFVLINTWLVVDPHIIVELSFLQGS